MSASVQGYNQGQERFSNREASSPDRGGDGRLPRERRKQEDEQQRENSSDRHPRSAHKYDEERNGYEQSLTKFSVD